MKFSQYIEEGRVVDAIAAGAAAQTGLNKSVLFKDFLSWWEQQPEAANMEYTELRSDQQRSMASRFAAWAKKRYKA